jgi:hypothetical protein
MSYKNGQKQFWGESYQWPETSTYVQYIYRWSQPFNMNFKHEDTLPFHWRAVHIYCLSSILTNLHFLFLFVLGPKRVHYTEAGGGGRVMKNSVLHLFQLVSSIADTISDLRPKAIFHTGVHRLTLSYIPLYSWTVHTLILYSSCTSVHSSYTSSAVLLCSFFTESCTAIHSSFSWPCPVVNSSYSRSCTAVHSSFPRSLQSCTLPRLTAVLFLYWILFSNSLFLILLLSSCTLFLYWLLYNCALFLNSLLHSCTLFLSARVQMNT